MIKIFWLPLLLIHFVSYRQGQAQNFVKGIYGTPERILKAGYGFEELGVNAIF